MPTWIWIVIVVLAVALVVFFVGLARARRRRITLTPPAATPAVTAPEAKPPAKGGYRAGGSISLSAGSGTALAPKPPSRPTPAESPAGTTPAAAAPAAAPAAPAAPVATPPAPVAHPVADRTEVDGQPGVGDDASVPRDSIRREVIDVQLPDLPGPVATAVAPAVVPEPAVAEPPAEARVAEPVSQAPPVPIVTAPALAAPPDAPVLEAGPEPAELPPAPTPAALEAPVAVVDEIDPAQGRLSRLKGRLSRSQNAFGRSLLGLLGAGMLDEDSWTDVEDTLLMADLGSAAAMEITERLRTEVAARGVADAASARSLLRRVLVDAVQADASGSVPDRSIRALPHDGRPSVLLVVGVNGTGKTTTTGKLARVLVAGGHTVVLGAADTFRAAAADQLATWAERAGATVVRGNAGADPAAVAFDAVKKGIDQGVDAVLIDTAGRLHTKTGLMDELGKVKRVVEKQAKVDEVLLVLDATTGQNGLVQAKVFAEVVDITGIVLTKLDGTAKGGIVVAVQRSLGVPVKLVGLGEGPDDLAPFEPEAFVDALLGD